MKRDKPGRPPVEDPKTYLPHVTIRESVVAEMKRIASATPRIYLSHHVEKALELYVKRYNSGEIPCKCQKKRKK